MTDTSRVSGGDATPVAVTTPMITATSTSMPAQVMTSEPPTTRVSETSAHTAFAPSLDPETLAQLSDGDAVTVLLPFAPLPLAEWANAGGSRTPSGGTVWGASWNWSAVVGSLPRSGPDWSLIVTGPPSGGTNAPDASALPLYEAAGFEVLYSNSDCSVGEGDATSAAIYVMKDGVVLATVQVFENVADCGLGWQTMSPSEMLHILENARVCELAPSAVIVDCSDPLQPAEDERALIVGALATPAA